MTISSPASPYSRTSQPATQFQVWLGLLFSDPPGTPPFEWVPEFYPVTSHLTANGRRDDVITIQVKEPERIMDLKSGLMLNGKSLMQRQIQIRALDEDGEPTILVAWGMISRMPILVDGSSEIYSIEARIGDEHFGHRFDGYPIFDPLRSLRVDVMMAMQFNPEIDGIIEPNMSDKTDDETEFHYVLHPESIRTAASRELQAQTASLWHLSEAVHALCFWLNPDENFITNPTMEDLTAAFAARNDMLKNVTIPLGTSLPDALDILLLPLEYGWHLVHSLNDDDETVTTIRFYQRGIGRKRILQMQRPGETRDITKTQVITFDAMASIIDLTNRVVCYGAIERREITISLEKAWSNSYDTKPLYQLRDKSDFAIAHPEVGRKWVVDLAGDYIGLRPELSVVADLTGIFTEELVVKRRKFERCLTQHQDADDRESNGYYVDWYNEHAPGAVSPGLRDDPGWQRIKWPFSVLEKEAGIVFDGETPPPQLWSIIYGGHPEKARVRITATLVGDKRVKGDAVRLESSKHSLDIPLTLDVSDKFQDSRVDDSLNYGSIFYGDPTDARDDTTAIQTYAETIRTAEDALRLDTSIPLEGCNHPEYQIGDVLPLIKGRNLPLDLATNRYPQIVGIVHHFQSQQVELLLESFRKERPRVVLSNNGREVVAPKTAAAPQTRKQIYGRA